MEAERKKVLVVEDESKIVELLKDFLEANGYEVQTESSGTEALDYAATHKSDLVILDLRLPDISGFEVSERLRQIYDHASTRILMLTAMDRAEDREHGFEMGADAYMSKPFEFGELGDTVTALINGEIPGGAPEC